MILFLLNNSRFWADILCLLVEKLYRVQDQDQNIMKFYSLSSKLNPFECNQNLTNEILMFKQSQYKYFIFKK